MLGGTGTPQGDPRRPQRTRSARFTGTRCSCRTRAPNGTLVKDGGNRTIVEFDTISYRQAKKEKTVRFRGEIVVSTPHR